MERFRISLIILLIGLVMVGCGDYVPITSTPTAGPSPTASLVPSETVSPDPGETAIPSLEPTETTEPTPTKLPDFVTPTPIQTQPTAAATVIGGEPNYPRKSKAEAEYKVRADADPYVNIRTVPLGQTPAVNSAYPVVDKLYPGMLVTVLCFYEYGSSELADIWASKQPCGSANLWFAYRLSGQTFFDLALEGPVGY